MVLINLRPALQIRPCPFLLLIFLATTVLLVQYLSLYYLQCLLYYLMLIIILYCTAHMVNIVSARGKGRTLQSASLFYSSIFFFLRINDYGHYSIQTWKLRALIIARHSLPGSVRFGGQLMARSSYVFHIFTNRTISF